MTDTISPLKESDLDAYVEIMAAAYPGLKIVSSDDHQRMRDRLAATYEDPSTTIYGLKHNGRLLAGMILYDFTMNVRGAMLPAGGLGSLAVGLLDRKRKAAKKMVSYYLEHYRRQGVALALLYPFRTDFYLRMGFGYGAKMNRYVFSPRRLRAPSSDRAHLRFLDRSDVDRTLTCFDGYAAAQHGMILGSRQRVAQLLSNPAIRTVGYVQDDDVLGYLAFDFENRDHFLKNDMRVRQLIYLNGEVLGELLAFLQSLADQVEWIVLNTQERNFHHLLTDPRNRTEALIPSVYHESNTQGVGLMYRVIDPRLLFESEAGARFGQQPITLKLSLVDSFISRNTLKLSLRFEDGRATLVDAAGHDAEIEMSIGDFSSLFMGAATLEQLVRYGLAKVSDLGAVKKISDLLATDTLPICMTAF